MHSTERNLQEQWERLLGYAQECVAAESSTALAPHAGERGRSCWHAVPGAERLVTGEADSVPAPPDLAALLDSPKSRDAPARQVAVGWPAVVVRDMREKGRPESVAPLFAVQASPKRERNGRWVLVADTEPEFNLTVAAAGLQDSSVADEIEALGVETSLGNAPAVAKAAVRACALLGIPVSVDLDPGAVTAVPADLPPGAPAVHNLAVSIVAELSKYRLSLHKELKALQGRTDWGGTAAALLVDGEEGSPGQDRERSARGPLAAPLPVNRSQEETLERIRSDALTVVTGPPGTGKTQLVVNAVANAWLDGDTVLVASTNNAAVDVAAERGRDVATGLILRTGNYDERRALPDRANAARMQAEDIVTGEPEHEARDRLATTAGARTALLRRVARLAELDRELLDRSRSLAEARNARAEAAGALWPGGAAPVGVAPARTYARASRLKNVWLFGNWRRTRFRNGIGCSADATMEEIARWAGKALHEAELAAGFAQGRAEREKLAAEMGGAESDAEAAASGGWAEASLASIRAHVAGRILAALPPAFGTARGSGGKFPKALAASLEAFRGWACTTLSARSNFPLQSGLFDLAIVDEASQCDLAAVLPIAYRAKRLAVVGDPEQLRPIANLSSRFLDEIAVRKGLDAAELRQNGWHHGKGSAYRAFAFALGRPAALLDEHYRCHPYIVRWFNRAFYQDRLTVLTDVSGFASGRAIAWRDVPGTARRSASGSWEHPAQASAAVEEIGTLLGRGLSVGVVTPYAAQERLIKNLAHRVHGAAALDEAGFVCGTAHRLQGDERDAVIFVSVLSPGMPPRSAAWVEKERNLLNVAVSRARQTLIAIGHPEAGTAGSPTLASLRDYLRRYSENDTTGMRAAPDLIASDAEGRALEAMQAAGLEPLSKVHEKGYELDFALLDPGGVKLNVEIDGDQHHDTRGEQRRTDHARDRLLRKLGWRVLRIPAWRCHEDPDGVGEEIARAFHALIKA